MKLLPLVLLVATLSACTSKTSSQPADCQPPGIDNVNFSIDSQEVVFEEGQAAVEIPDLDGKTAVINYRLIESATGDLDRDSDMDLAAVFQVDPGGSGTFYHLAAALNDGCRSHAVESVYLGDRIQPESLTIYGSDHIDAGMIVAGLNVFAKDQSLSEKPMFYLTRMFRVDSSQLIEIPQY